MFDVLVFLYENYSALSACPDFEALTRRLADAGFDEDEIADAMVWLHGLASVTLSSRVPDDADHHRGFRVYTSQEYSALGPTAIGFIASLERDGQLNPAQREIVIERAAAVDTPVTLERLKIIVLMVLWSQSVDVDLMLLQELLDDDPGPALH